MRKEIEKKVRDVESMIVAEILKGNDYPYGDIVRKWRGFRCIVPMDLKKLMKKYPLVIQRWNFRPYFAGIWIYKYEGARAGEGVNFYVLELYHKKEKYPHAVVYDFPDNQKDFIEFCRQFFMLRREVMLRNRKIKNGGVR
jgi:hypothetical protein